MIEAPRVISGEVQFLGDKYGLANLCNTLIHSDDVSIFKYVASDDGRNQVHVWLKEEDEQGLKWNQVFTAVWAKKIIRKASHNSE